MMQPILLAITTCVLATALEGAFAGRRIKQRFAQLRLPRFSPSLGLWIVIGAAYYLICCIVLYRLFLLPPGTCRWIAIGLMFLLLLANAMWNYFFFRFGNLSASFAIGMMYSAIAVALLGVLFVVDPTAGWCFLPYPLYLIYAKTGGGTPSFVKTSAAFES